MTYSISGRCPRTGRLGLGITTFSLAVGGRCEGLAANVGFQKGDIITQVNGQKIAKTADLERATRDASRLWRITLQRGGQQLSVVLGG